MTCPECGLKGAEIKEQKARADGIVLLYRWCPDCNAQYFPRTIDASERLRAKMASPVTVREPETVVEQKPEAKKKEKMPWAKL
jgi:ssDNA-binding Zn-finger/Zn-ribbon topoisomerase 1